MMLQGVVAYLAMLASLGFYFWFGSKLTEEVCSEIDGLIMALNYT
jgi:hypothetical protein